MAKFIKGDIVVIPFPFSDLSGSKKRPAFVLANLEGDDIILCQITSQKSLPGTHSVSLGGNDFFSGSLPADSFIKYSRIFTADKSIIDRKAGHVQPHITQAVVSCIIKLLNA